MNTNLHGLVAKLESSPPGQAKKLIDTLIPETDEEVEVVKRLYEKYAIKGRKTRRWFIAINDPFLLDGIVDEKVEEI